MYGDNSEDEHEDLIAHLEREDHRHAVRLAWRWGLGVPAVTLLCWLVLWLFTGDSTVTHVVPVLVSLAGAVGVCVLTSWRWNRYRDWAPLMGAVWTLIPWFLLVATSLLQKLILGE